MSLNALILGATGLCGSGFLKYAAKDPAFAKVFTITRREIPSTLDSEKVNSLVIKESETWPNSVPEKSDVVFTALATTREQAGKEHFYWVDHDLNLQLAQKAKENGCKTFVLVSSAGASEKSPFFYFKTKAEIERDILALNFEKTIILRPGALFGARDKPKGIVSRASAKLGSYLYRTRFQFLFGYPVSGDEVGKVGVLLATDPSNTASVRIVESAEILDLAAKS